MSRSNEPRSLAKSVCTRYGTRNSVFLARRMGCVVLSASLGRVRGFCMKIKRQKFIFINESLSEAEALFVCAHELGHLLMHPHYNALFMLKRTHLKISPLEAEADLFAFYLLFNPNRQIWVERLKVPDAHDGHLDVWSRLAKKYPDIVSDYVYEVMKNDLPELQL